MSELQWLWDEEPATENELLHIEEEMGYPIPEELKVIFREHNAASPVRTLIRPNGNREYIFNSLLNVRENDKEPSILESYKQYCEFLPLGMMPFASDPFGNLFCIDLADTKSVWLFLHDVTDQSQMLVKIAANVKKFVALLKSVEPPA